MHRPICDFNVTEEICVCWCTHISYCATISWHNKSPVLVFSFWSHDLVCKLNSHRLLSFCLRREVSMFTNRSKNSILVRWNNAERSTETSSKGCFYSMVRLCGHRFFGKHTMYSVFYMLIIPISSHHKPTIIQYHLVIC